MKPPVFATQLRLRAASAALAGLAAASLLCAARPAVAAEAAPLQLPFSAFFKRPIGPLGLEPSDRLRQADGQRVRLQGYMVAREQQTPGRFLLTPRPVRLSEHADGEADDLPPATVTVLLHDSQRTRQVAHRPGVLSLTGRLQVGRVEEADGRVSWFRLQLEPEALESAASPPPQAATHHHHH